MFMIFQQFVCWFLIIFLQFNPPRKNLSFSFYFFCQCLPATFKACWGEEKEREKAMEETHEVHKFLEEELKEKRFFGGESIGMVDIIANTIAFWHEVFEEASGVKLFMREKFPKLTNWSHEFMSNSVVKECLPPRDKLITYFQIRLGGANASK
jgi:glutathione S-transferase